MLLIINIMYIYILQINQFIIKVVLKCDEIVFKDIIVILLQIDHVPK